MKHLDTQASQHQDDFNSSDALEKVTSKPVISKNSSASQKACGYRFLDNEGTLFSDEGSFVLGYN